MVELLGSWTNGDIPLFRALAGAVSGLIERGQLEPGVILPPERALAGRLVVSRSTVLRAYDELKRSGWLTSRRGSGTSVLPRAPQGPVAAAADRPLPFPAESLLFSGLANGMAISVDLSVSALPALDLVWDEYQRVDVAKLRALGRHHGYQPAGLPELRSALAEHMSASGVATSPDEILVTTGAAQALTLIAVCYLRAGDGVLVEDPTCPVALAALRTMRARLVPIPVGAQGANVHAVRRGLAGTGIRMVCVTPSFNNPTGTLMPASQRAALAELSRRFEVPLVEDLVNADIGFGDPVPAPVAACDPGAPVLSVGSLGKLFWSGLRIGWVRASAPTIAHLARIKSVADLGSSIPEQIHAVRLLGVVDEARAQRRAQLAPRLERLCGTLAAHLPDWSWERPLGGLSLWARLPWGDAPSFATQALYQGVAVVPGGVLSASGDHDAFLRIAFAAEPDAIEAGVRGLARAWTAYRPPRGVAQPASRRAAAV